MTEAITQARSREEWQFDEHGYVQMDTIAVDLQSLLSEPEAGECPEGEIRGRSGYCAVLPKECPPGTSIDEDPICEPGFNQDCPLGTKLKADKTGCEPIECGDGEILQGDQCVPAVRECDYLAGEECPAGTDIEPEPTPEPVAPQPQPEPEPQPDPEPEPEPDPGNVMYPHFQKLVK